MYVLWFPWLQRTIEQWRRRGGEGHSVSQDIRPGAGFKTGDFVEEKLGGATVERRKYQNNDDKTIHPQTQYPSMYWRSSMHVLVYYYISFATSSRRCIAWVSKTRNMMKEHSNIQMKAWNDFRCFQQPETTNTTFQVFYKKYFKDVSREFDEFRVNTHLCTWAALLVLVIYYMDEFFIGGEVLLWVYYFYKYYIMVGGGNFTSSGGFRAGSNIIPWYISWSPPNLCQAKYD